MENFPSLPRLTEPKRESFPSREGHTFSAGVHFLASAEKEERIIIQEKIKNLYDIRCKISHSGTSKKLSERDFYELLKILKAIMGFSTFLRVLSITSLSEGIIFLIRLLFLPVINPLCSPSLPRLKLYIQAI